MVSNEDLENKAFHPTPYSDQDLNRLARQRSAAVGEKNNDCITNCRTCASNGYPHEAIDFERIQGRMLADGTRETAGWRLKNYCDGTPHEHKRRMS